MVLVGSGGSREGLLDHYMVIGAEGVGGEVGCSGVLGLVGGLIGVNGIVCSSGHGAGMDSVCTRGVRGGWIWWVRGVRALDGRCIILGWVRVLSLRR